ncbi:hypothetical protein CRUP_009476 [Coryphaenoides rupestris]|nr:hypothetical protein CRUP_009476 [Coryphaenoides rupestris]
MYAVAEASKNETGGGDGVKVLVNEPYEKENGEKGQFTHKIYYLESKVPKIISAIAPKGSLENKYMEESFFINIETWHKPDMGEQDNDYKADEDPATYVSKKTNRGPLGPNWKEELKNNPNCPHMCAYKLQESRLFANFHRQLFCWLDRWVDLSMDDIRRMEDETQKELDKMRLEGEVKGMTGNN